VDPTELADKLVAADQVVTVSDYNADHLAQRHGRRPVRIYNGLPLERFPFQSVAGARDELVAVGRLVEKKGFEILLTACAHMRDAGRRFHCTIVGDGPLRGSLEQQIADLGLGGIVVLRGALSPEVVRECISAARVCAVPSRIAEDGDRDGLPTVAIEAMALGTACVASDVTGMKELVLHEQTGLLVPAADPIALAAACDRLFDDDSLVECLRRSARRHVEQRFDVERNAAEMRRALWSRGPKIVFRIHNRNGLGHWMRGMNVARDLLVLEPRAEITFFARTAPPIPIDDPRIRHVEAVDPERMPLAEVEDFTGIPSLVVDDTIVPEDRPRPGTRHVLILRIQKRERMARLLDEGRLGEIDAIVAPHVRAELEGFLPDAVLDRIHFVGTIARGVDDEAVARVRERYGIGERDRLLVSTPGGGGFKRDFDRFRVIAESVHRSISKTGWRQIFVCGPNSSGIFDPLDENMLVVSSDPEMPALFSQATVVLSAGGYNSVHEIRLARRPAIFLPGARSYDDQHARVAALVERGSAWMADPEDPPAAAREIVARLQDRIGLERLANVCAGDDLQTGNRAAAEAVLACLRS
jgi:hypothetical protein